MNVPKLRFSEFFDNWSQVKLGDIYPQIRNGFVGIATPFYVETGIQYLQGKNVKNGAIDPTGLIYVSEVFNNKYKKSQLKLNDIVMVQSGHVGECAVISENYVDANCHALIVLTPKKSELTSSSFFVYYFYTKYGKKLIHQIKTGNTIEHVLASEVKNLSPLAPTFKEQTKIANFLTAVDEKITQLTQKSDLLAQYKKGVMQKIFSQELRFKDDDGREFPEWDLKDGGDIFDSVTNKNHNSDLPILAITQEYGAIPRDLIEYQISVTDKSVESYKVVEIGDFIISLRSFQGGIEYSKYKGICSPAYIILRPKQKIVDDFYKYFLKTEGYIKSLSSKLEGIRDGKMVSYKYFSEIQLPYPCEKEQTKIANFLTAIDDKITQTQAELDAVKQYKQGLLQQMFV